MARIEKSLNLDLQQQLSTFERSQKYFYETKAFLYAKKPLFVDEVF